MADVASRADAQPLCAAEELVERGRAVGFDVMLWRQPARAFALRFGGRVVAYINRCAHVQTEMDWQPGEFFDDEKRHIVCAIHGATYEPSNGHCVGGPCGRGRLMAIEISERDGQVYWYPSRDISPLSFDDDGDVPPDPPSTPP
jgi:nitrite reductase/ring-hydroxylating ferredoxin subunit